MSPSTTWLTRHGALAGGPETADDPDSLVEAEVGVPVGSAEGEAGGEAGGVAEGVPGGVADAVTDGVGAVVVDPAVAAAGRVPSVGAALELDTATANQPRPSTAAATVGMTTDRRRAVVVTGKDPLVDENGHRVARQRRVAGRS